MGGRYWPQVGRPHAHQTQRYSLRERETGRRIVGESVEDSLKGKEERKEREEGFKRTSKKRQWG